MVKQTVVSVNGKKVVKKVDKSKYGGYKNPPILFPVVSEVNSLGDSKQIKQETKHMTRQVPSLLNLSNTSSVAVPSAVTSVESMGVTSDFTTLEIRATLKPGAKKQTLFTFHGGSVMKSKKGNLFTAFMLRPFIYSREGNKDILVNNETGELQHSSVKSLLVKGVDQTIPADIEPIVSMLKVAPEAQRELAIGMLRTQPSLDIDRILSYLTGSSLVHQEVSPAKLLNSLFKHENVRFKANISSKWENKIDSIIDRISGGDDKYSIILRFDLSKVNAIKELGEVQHYLEDGSLAARLHPITGDVVQLQEVSIALTYIGLEKGSTYDEDTSKYLNPSLVINAALSATKDVENPVYMDYSIIEARAEKVNAWKANMAKFTGKKFLQNSGIVDTLYKLAESYASGNEESIKEANSIYEALKADERVGEVKATKIWATFQEKVQEAANQPEPSENISTSESTSEQVESQEETTSVTEEAVDLLSSPAFSLTALLQGNLGLLGVDED
jgi:hypothetical protein